jgi:hypothetical protein
MSDGWPVFRNTAMELTDKLVKVAYDLIDSGGEEIGEKLLDVAHEMKAHTLRRAFPPDELMAGLKAFLNDLHIEFAIIGGVALAVHGQLRESEDIDALVGSMPPASKTQDVEYMGKFGFYPAKSQTGNHLILDSRTGGGYVELLLANDSLRKEAITTAVSQNILGSSVPVVIPETLIALKVAATTSNPSRFKKDSIDIFSVIQTSNPDISKIESLLNPEELMVWKSIYKE